MPTNPVDFKNLHILIVDDDTAMLDIIEALLKSFGVGTISRATSGAEAYNVLSRTDKVVDCTLCDYSMANGNGLQLLQAVRLGQVTHCRPDTSFVLLTSSGDAAVVAMAAELDVSGYIVKPATPEKLQSAIVKARGRAIKIDRARYGRVTVPI
jgi:CheY-like chemotaxis protein